MTSRYVLLARKRLRVVQAVPGILEESTNVPQGEARGR